MSEKKRKAHAKRLGLKIIPARKLLSLAELSKIKGVSADRLQAIKDMVVPPAWKDVRYAKAENAHLQVTGLDAKGRLQCIYHPQWKSVRDAVKQERLLRFGKALPAIRKQVAADLKRSISCPKSVIATAVRLIDRQLIRIGAERYLENGTKGASTLESADVDVSNNEVSITFKGKSGRKIHLDLKDPVLKKKIEKLQRRNKGRLFKAGNKKLKSAMINRYLSKAAGKKISAKDFRTFEASAQAVSLFCDTIESDKKATISLVAREVSETLQNTPAVARSSYIHPSIIEAHNDKRLKRSYLTGRKRNGLERHETALMRFLEDHTATQAKE